MMSERTEEARAHLKTYREGKEQQVRVLRFSPDVEPVVPGNEPNE